MKYGFSLLLLLCTTPSLVACGGGSGTGTAGSTSSPPPAPPPQTCDGTSDLVDGICQPFAVRMDARATTPFVENDQPVTLEVVLFRPPQEGRYPTLVFNHGSTGSGSDPSLFGETFVSKSVTRFFTERGWMVAYPQRRGRGASDGLYDEGFSPGRGGYSCEAATALAGAQRALDDLDAATDWLRQRPDVDTTRMLIGGSSRGGILSVAYVARRPEVYLGAVNFVGGWLGEGCGDHRQVNRALVGSAARFPGQSLWLYATNDSFYSLPYSRENFQAFAAAGGLGTFAEFSRAPGLNGHFLVNDPPLWETAMDDYLAGF